MSGIVEVIVQTIGPQGPSGPAGGTFGGDLAVKTSTTQTVVGLQNLPLPAPSTNYTTIQYVGGVLSWVAQGATILTGDVTGTVSNGVIATTLAAIDGHALPAPSGTNTLLWWSGSALSWVTVSGGATSLTGDVTGTIVGSSIATTLAAIDGHALPAPTGIGTYLEYTGSALVWSAVSGSGAQSLSGDVTGTIGGTNIATRVVAIDGYTIDNTDIATSGASLTSTGSGLAWVTGVPVSQGALSLSGDVTGTISGTNIPTTLAAIDGVTLPSPSGAGTVLTYTGSALTWGTGGSNPIIQLTGDVVGHSTSPIVTTVEGLWGQSLPDPVGSGGGVYLGWSGSALGWTTPPSGGGGGTGITSLYNDITTPLSSSGATQATAVALTGAGGVATIRCNTLSWPITTSPEIYYSGSNNFSITVAGTLSITTGSGSPYLNFNASNVQLAMTSSSLTLSATVVSLAANGTICLEGTSGTINLAAGSTTVLAGGGSAVQLVYTSGNYIQVQVGEISAVAGGAGVFTATSTSTSIGANNAYILEGTATTTTLLAASTAWAQATATTTVLFANGSTILQGSASQTSLSFGSNGIVVNSSAIELVIGGSTSWLDISTAGGVAWPQLTATPLSADSTHYVNMTFLVSGTPTVMKVLLHT